MPGVKLIGFDGEDAASVIFNVASSGDIVLFTGFGIGFCHVIASCVRSLGLRCGL